MKKYLIKVSGEQFEVEVEEVMNGYSNKPVSTVSESTVSKPSAVAPAQASKNGRTTVESPMPGNILKILVKKGDMVIKGQTLFLLEAMKMENEIKSPSSGIIADLKANEGDPVTVGQAIVLIG